MQRFIKCLLICLLVISLSGCRVRVKENEQSGKGSHQIVDGNEHTTDNGNGEVQILEGDYEGLLRVGLGDLYPCQYVLVYSEDKDGNIYRQSSKVSSILLGAGAENVGNYLIGEVNLDTLNSLNPMLFIKFVDRSILSSDVFDVSIAKAFYDDLVNNHPLKDLNCIKTRSILLLSEELLDTPNGILTLKLIVAYNLYENLFKSLDLQKVVASYLVENALYYYK